MSSSGKKRTTMAKLSRESRLRERRLDKQARRDARRQAASGDPTQHAGDPPDPTIAEPAAPDPAQAARDASPPPPPDA